MGNSWLWDEGIHGNSWEFMGIHAQAPPTPTMRGQSLLLVFTYVLLIKFRLQGRPSVLVHGPWKSSELSSNIILLLFQGAYRWRRES